MIDFSSILTRARKAAADNSPAILTAIGVAGTVTTAYLTGKASFKAAEVIRDNASEKKEPAHVTTQENIEAVWKLYVPAVGTGLITIGSIIGANRVSTRRSAAMAAAYSLSQDAFREYKSKVLERFGETQERSVRDEIAQDFVNKNPPSTTVVIGIGNQLCCDRHTARYFMSTLENLKKAENDTNYQILHDNCASLTDFWDRLGLVKTDESDEIGWNSDRGLKIDYGAAIAEDGQSCITVSFMTVPIRNYDSVYYAPQY